MGRLKIKRQGPPLTNPYSPTGEGFAERNAPTHRTLPNGMVIECKGEPLPPLKAPLKVTS